MYVCHGCKVETISGKVFLLLLPLEKRMNFNERIEVFSLLQLQVVVGETGSHLLFAQTAADAPPKDVEKGTCAYAHTHF